MLIVLRQRNFALLWLGNIVSVLGDWILLVALPFYVYQRTGSALATGATFIIETIPTVLLGSLSAVFTDRWDRRRTLIVTNLLQAILLLPLLAVQSRAELWIVYVVALLQSSISQFASPAYSAWLPNLLDETDQLTAANGAMSVAAESTRLIGPTLGGAMLSLLGLKNVVLADSLSFGFCAIMIQCIVPPPRTRMKQLGVADSDEACGSVWREWRLGLRLLATEPVIGALFVVTGIAMLGEGTIRAVFVPFFSHVSGGNALVFGWILTAQGLGGLIGSLTLHCASRLLHPFRLLALGAALAGIFVQVEVTFPTVLVALICSFLIGAPIVFFFVSVNTVLQLYTDDRFRGRIFGAFNATSTMLLLVGMVLSSLLADHTGHFFMLALGGGFYMLAGMIAYLLLRRRLTAPTQMVLW